MTIVAFLVYFFCENLGYTPTTVFQLPSPPGMNEKKQTSYKVLMGLIFLMLAIQTIHAICNWYVIWLGFIYYSNAPDQALDALEEDEVKLCLWVVDSMFTLLTVLRLAIADSIMVSTDSYFQPVLIVFNLKVWRCWIICNGRWMVAITPLIFNLVSIGV